MAFSFQISTDIYHYINQHKVEPEGKPQKWTINTSVKLAWCNLLWNHMICANCSVFINKMKG